MQKKLILIIIPFFFSCSTLPRSQGEGNQVVIFASPEDKLQIEPSIQKLFYEVVRTPQSEPKIKVSWQNPWDLDLYKFRPNLIIISLDHPPDSTGDHLIKKFKSVQVEKNNIFIAENLFAQNQQVVTIHAQDAIHFQELLYNNGSWISKEINKSIDDNIWEHIIEKGRNESLEDSLSTQFGINAYIQADYQLIANSADFLWLGRGYPYRWLTFTLAKSYDFLSIKNAWVNVEKYFKETMPGINLLEMLRSEDKVVVGGVTIRVMRGIYEHIESNTGGPFVIYLFEGHRENEVILVSGFVNNPGHEKAPLLRQLELTIQKMKFN